MKLQDYKHFGEAAITAPIVQKAYEIDLNRLQNGFESAPIVCYASGTNQAKQKLLQQVKYDDWLTRTGDTLSYLNIPVVRAFSSDKVTFEGAEVVRSQIPSIISERERLAVLNQILNNPEVDFCYIKKGHYYRPNSCGYTDFLHEAGVYPKSEAFNHAKSVKEIRLIPVNIAEHNKMLNEKIKDMKSRLL